MQHANFVYNNFFLYLAPPNCNGRVYRKKVDFLSLLINGASTSLLFFQQRFKGCVNIKHPLVHTSSQYDYNILRYHIINIANFSPRFTKSMGRKK